MSLRFASSVADSEFFSFAFFPLAFESTPSTKTANLATYRSSWETLKFPVPLTNSVYSRFVSLVSPLCQRASYLKMDFSESNIVMI